MRLPSFGRAIQRNRKLAGMGVQELAHCLTDGDHAVAVLAAAPSPVKVLQRLERSGTWPYDDDDAWRDFIVKCAGCLARGDTARERVVLHELVLRASHDLAMGS